MTPETLAQWRHDAVLMREFLRSQEWAAFRRHLEALRDDALAQEDAQPPDKVDEVMHYRAGRLAFAHALRLPEIIAEQAKSIESAAEAAKARERAQKGRRG